MNSGVYLASKACLLLCILGFSAGVFGKGCPPDDPNMAQFKHSACTRAIGAEAEFDLSHTASFPGVPNMDGNFGCADRFVRIPLCCTKVSEMSHLPDHLER
ncbi:hypothetical protein VP01_2565g2 [Puccinia sorghi]|uniref:Uncharacterized protein n=1 Tax=Puccinia sorghi TaxID=27349 RepID=A0A0L6V571_9BASI|nr:hypothetical protein VP01_2565g2 [Puccinia sorghi]